MKNLSKGWWWSKLGRVQNGLGVTQKELAQILKVSSNQLKSWMRTTLGRTDVDEAIFDKCEELEKLIRFGNVVLDSNMKFKKWLRSKDLPVYGDASPLDYVKQGDCGMVMYSLSVIAGDSCA